MADHNLMRSPRQSVRNRFSFAVGGIILVLVIVVGGYFLFFRNGTGQLGTLQPPVAVASEFGTYVETPVTVSPKIPTYAVAQNLSNVTNASDFTLSAAAKKLLVKNAFVVVPGLDKEFFQLYEADRYRFIPNFVTTDSILHNYHLMFDFLLKRLEEDKLATGLRSLNTSMLAEALRQYDSLKGSTWENAAKRNVGFFAVGSKLLDPSVAIPPLVTAEVTQELSLIDAHQGIAPSVVMNLGSTTGVLDAAQEDYSQYIPRGHYEKSEQLRAYFKSMMWYGRLTFRLKNQDEMKSAMLITLALNQNDNQKSWNTLYEPINFFVGKSDDITYLQFKDSIEHVYGDGATVQTVADDRTKFSEFVTQTNALEPPKINSIPILNVKLQPDRETEIKGFRFMGQRFTIDAAIFQQLVTRDVGPKGVSCAGAPFAGGRFLPKGLDIPSAMGSKEAQNILTDLGETQYACYPENMTHLQSYVAGLPTSTWTQNLYWAWLYQLKPLTDMKPAGYPSFMQNFAWLRKDLNTFLGSWTELKHDTILYAKQVYAELGGGGPEKKDDRGYVEPHPYVFARLASLLTLTSEGLDTRGLLDPAMKVNLGTMKDLALSLKTISEKELNNETLSDAEYELIRSYGGQLEHFWLEVNKDEPAFKASTGQADYLDQNPAALVADVATDPNGEVLEEGTGYISEIYTVVPVDGKLRIAKGGVYSYYEFPWPLSDRLTDTKWRDLLDTGKAPALPSWTSEFFAH